MKYPMIATKTYTSPDYEFTLSSGKVITVQGFSKSAGYTFIAPNKAWRDKLLAAGGWRCA